MPSRRAAAARLPLDLDRQLDQRALEAVQDLPERPRRLGRDWELGPGLRRPRSLPKPEGARRRRVEVDLPPAERERAHACPLDRVLELADVPGPRVAAELFRWSHTKLEASPRGASLHLMLVSAWGLRFRAESTGFCGDRLAVTARASVRRQGLDPDAGIRPQHHPPQDLGMIAHWYETRWTQDFLLDAAHGPGPSPWRAVLNAPCTDGERPLLPLNRSRHRQHARRRAPAPRTAPA